MQMGKFGCHGGKTVTQKMLEDKRQVNIHTNFSKCFNENLGAQILAVDEHAIAVKNDKGNFAQTGSNR